MCGSLGWWMSYICSFVLHLCQFAVCCCGPFRLKENSEILNNNNFTGALRHYTVYLCRNLQRSHLSHCPVISNSTASVFHRNTNAHTDIPHTQTHTVHGKTGDQYMALADCPAQLMTSSNQPVKKHQYMAGRRAQIVSHFSEQ